MNHISRREFLFGAAALVAIPGDTEPQEYTAGAYTVKRHLPAAGNPFSAITSPGT